MATTDAVYATARPAERSALLHLTARSDLKGLAQLACHLCALLGTGALVWSVRSTPWLLPAMLLHGIILVFLFAPLHEAVHNAERRIMPRGECERLIRLAEPCGGSA
jgi:fatty acid desaturase